VLLAFVAAPYPFVQVRSTSFARSRCRLDGDCFREVAMQAAVLNAFGQPLAIETLPDPVLGTGEVIVDVVAAGVTSYAAHVFDGSRNYLLDPPVVPGPGGVGRVRATGRTPPD
jgi:hypothetical protein